MSAGMPDTHFRLSRDLGDGLLLRWATPDDIEAVVEHNIRHLSDDPTAPNESFRGWVRTPMSGEHPTTTASDFTIVTDEHDGGKIVSSMNLISQTWSYGGLPLKVGRPELVSTDPAYRRKGLVSAQFAAIHALSAARGEMMQVIDGVGWFYRQFGYEMALARGGSRHWLPSRIPPRPADDAPAYRLRLATSEDIPSLDRLYAIHCAGSLVARLRDAAEWRYELGWQKFWLVEDAAGAVVGHAQARVSEGGHDPEQQHVFSIDEMAVLPGHSLRALAEFLGQEFGAQLAELNKTRTTPLNSLLLDLGTQHPAYTALGDLLEQYRPYWAWYVRVPDLPAFLRYIAPLLEQRLAASVMAGHNGTLRLNLYRSQIALVFSAGKLTEVGTFTLRHLEDGDARFSDQTFLHLLLGHRTPAEVNYLFAECNASPAATVLLNILFPQQPSNPVPLS